MQVTIQCLHYLGYQNIILIFLPGTRGSLHSWAPGLCPPCTPHCYDTDREPVWGLVYYMMVKPPVYLSVCLSVCLCLLVTIMKHAKMDKRVDIPFRMWTYGGH